ncbi:hypothetical protein V2A60_002201 [Cordyceps javanica]
MKCVRLNHTAIAALAAPPSVPGAFCTKFALVYAAATRRASTFSATIHRRKSEDDSRFIDRLRRSTKPSNAPRTVPRMLSVDVAKFVRNRDGHLTTTPENARFFREHPTVDHDHGTMIRLDATDAVRRLAQAYGVRLAWSPRHVIHPHRLRYLDPHGHPLAPKLRSDCARKTREKALWAFATSTAGVSAVVWQLTKRELLRSVFRSLATRGYDEHGRKADRTELHGTLWLTVWEPQHARRLSVDNFGEVVADTLDKHYATRPEQRNAASLAEAPHSEEQRRVTKHLNGAAGSTANNTGQWQPRERVNQKGGRVRASTAETDMQSTWQPRKRK